jgi:hypothetical protein
MCANARNFPSSLSEPSPVEGEEQSQQPSDDATIYRESLRKIAEIRRKQQIRPPDDAIRREALRKMAEMKRKQNERRKSERVLPGSLP